MMKNSLRNTVLLLGFAFFSTTLLASDGWLAYDSQIKAVNTNGNNNGSTVGVVVEGGSGPCNNSGKSGNLRGWIHFQEQNGISKSAFKSFICHGTDSTNHRQKGTHLQLL
jgi:hypothetical protein